MRPRMAVEASFPLTLTLPPGRGGTKCGRSNGPHECFDSNPPKQPTTKEAAAKPASSQAAALLLRTEEHVPRADGGCVRAVGVTSGRPGCSRIQAGGGIQCSAPGPGHGHYAAGDTDVCDLYLRGTDDLVIRFDRVR